MRELADVVDAPYLCGIHPELGGEPVDRALDHLDRLRPSRAAERRDLRRVRHDRRAFRLDPWDVVHAARHQRGQVREECAEGRIGAAVGEDVELVGENLAVLRPADREAEPHRPAVRQCQHALAARLRPAHRPVELARQPAHEDLLRQAARGHDLRSESTADVRRDDAHLVRLHAEHPRDCVPVLMGGLRAQPDGQPAVLERRCGRPRLERTRCHPLADEHVGDGHLATVEQVVRVFHGLRPGGDVRPRLREEQRLVFQRFARVDHHRKRVVVDHHELGRVDTGRPVLADDDGDDLPDEANDILGHDRPAHLLEEAGKRRRPERRQADVVGREDADAGDRLGGALVDAVDLRVGEQRADERDRGGSLDRDVLDVLPAAAEETIVLRPQDPVPEDAHGEETNAGPRLESRQSSG